MIKTVRVISTEFNKVKKRIVKFLGNGLRDIQTAEEVGPCNIDSNPIKDMIAIYAETSVRGDTFIIGYINKNQLADVGEMRLYSTDASGTRKAYIWLKNNGNIELNGTADNAVRYSPLNTAMSNLASAINTELVKIAAGVATGGGSYTPSPVSINITGAKINEIKTN